MPGTRARHNGLLTVAGDHLPANFLTPAAPIRGRRRRTQSRAMNSSCRRYIRSSGVDLHRRYRWPVAVQPEEEPQTVGAHPLLAHPAAAREMELALDANLSPKHLSFVETGRSRPSRQLLAPHAPRPPDHRAKPRTACDGFAPPYLEQPSDGEMMRPRPVAQPTEARAEFSVDRRQSLEPDQRQSPRLPLGRSTPGSSIRSACSAARGPPGAASKDLVDDSGLQRASDHEAGRRSRGRRSALRRRIEDRGLPPGRSAHQPCVSSSFPGPAHTPRRSRLHRDRHPRGSAR